MKYFSLKYITYHEYISQHREKKVNLEIFSDSIVKYDFHGRFFALLKLIDIFFAT